MKLIQFAAAAMLAAAPGYSAAQDAAPEATTLETAAPTSDAAPEAAALETVAPETAAPAAADDGEKWAQEFLAKLDPKTGEIKLTGAKATLNIPDDYYFLDATDARAVLEEAWGNPPDDTVLGMVLPAGMSPLADNVWAATYAFQEDGYVSDKEAGKMNFDAMLKDMQQSTKDSNEWRAENGYGAVELIGWAEPPSYDAQTHKIFWAKELKFGEAETNTLNYDIRTLGRSGVLVTSFIASIQSLPEIRAAAPAVLKMAEFDEGARYTDYQPGVDKKAAYGLAGLVTGGLIAKKTGLLAALLLFGKKFGVIIFAALAGAGVWLKNKFAKKT